MKTIQINDLEAENFINANYDNDKTLVSDFITFVKTELITKDIKKGFDEVEEYKNGNTQLTDAKDFLNELKSEY